jgi:hypothetical protein
MTRVEPSKTIREFLGVSYHSRDFFPDTRKIHLVIRAHPSVPKAVADYSEPLAIRFGIAREDHPQLRVGSFIEL